MESDLISWERTDTYSSKRKLVDRILQIDPLNYYGISHLCRYYSESNIDSVSILFDNLMKKFPNNILPITLRIRFSRYEIGHSTYEESLGFELKYLYKALLIEPENRELLCELANKYYRDFLWPIEKNEYDELFPNNNFDSLFPVHKEIKISGYKHAKDSVLKYFNILWSLDYERNIIYYPIKQLEFLLDSCKESQIKFSDLKKIGKTCRPYQYIFDFPQNWERDSTIDYYRKAQDAIEGAYFELKHLNKMNEPCFFNKNEDYWGMRFLWWRTFDNNIIIRFENYNSKYKLTWKVQEGKGGYGPGGILKQGTLKIDKKEWDNFINNFNNSGMIDTKGRFVNMNDGAVWEFESIMKSKYSNYVTNDPDDKVRFFVDYLIKLAGIENYCKERY
jgi:hypothetical protein